MSLDSIDHQMEVARVSTDLKREFIQAGQMIDDGGDQGLGNFGEHGRVGHVEQIGMVHSTPEGTAALRDYMARSAELMADPTYNIISINVQHPFSREAREKQGRLLYNEHVWTRKIKETLDPNNAVDGSFYVSDVTIEGYAFDAKDTEST